ncbi:hypothetical protein Tco_1133174 [Tanacetum coccineum]|uniref:Uncharacterized protein n=1 Tax=Tanacetum coccineum TaxID=301880 RepID=A0ABQ5JE53_9ASTR
MAGWAETRYQGRCFGEVYHGRTLSPYCVFDFPVDELEPHPAYDFFAPRLLPGYAGNPNNNNGWLEADDYLLGELEAMVDEPMVVVSVKTEKLSGMSFYIKLLLSPSNENVLQMVVLIIVPAIEEVVGPVAEIEEEQVIAPIVDMEEDLATLFGDDDFEDDASDGFDEEEV